MQPVALGGTERSWALAEEYPSPVIMVGRKIDKESAGLTILRNSSVYTRFRARAKKLTKSTSQLGYMLGAHAEPAG